MFDSYHQMYSHKWRLRIDCMWLRSHPPTHTYYLPPVISGQDTYHRTHTVRWRWRSWEKQKYLIISHEIKWYHIKEFAYDTRNRSHQIISYHIREDSAELTHHPKYSPITKKPCSWRFKYSFTQQVTDSENLLRGYGYRRQGSAAREDIVRYRHQGGGQDYTSQLRVTYSIKTTLNIRKESHNNSQQAWSYSCPYPATKTT